MQINLKNNMDYTLQLGKQNPEMFLHNELRKKTESAY